MESENDTGAVCRCDIYITFNHVIDQVHSEDLRAELAVLEAKKRAAEAAAAGAGRDGAVIAALEQERRCVEVVSCRVACMNMSDATEIHTGMCLAELA